MDSSMSRAGLVSGMARMIFGTVPATDEGDLASGGARRAQRMQMLRDTMQSLSQRDARRTNTHRGMRMGMDD